MNAIQETEVVDDEAVTLSIQAVGPSYFQRPEDEALSVFDTTDLEALQIRSGILSLEAAMIALPNARFGNQDDCPLTHSFAGGIYVRNIFIPKGWLITGKIHRQEHPIFIMSGDLSIVDEFTGAKRIKGPCHFISKPGTKRLLYSHEDTVLVTVHTVGSERDIDKIEKMIATDTYEDYRKGFLCQ